MARQENFTYAQADAAFYEAMRINKGKSTEWSKHKEGNALIDPSKTEENYELVPHHSALDPSNFTKHNRGVGIAEYHKEQTGSSARMHGKEKHLSKAVGCIITLPKTYLQIDYGLTEQEYAAVSHYVENAKNNEPDSLYYKSAMEKISKHKFTPEEKKKIDEFFMTAFLAWKNVADIRDQDVLFAAVHWDESYPHVHIMALPTIEKENEQISYSTSKYNNITTHYFDKLHENLIIEMAKQGIIASDIINRATKDANFKPSDFTREQREEGVRIATQNAILKLAKEVAEANHMQVQSEYVDALEQLKETEGKIKDICTRLANAEKEYESITESAERRKDELMLLESEKDAEERQLEEIVQKKLENESLSKKEYKKYLKELQRIQKTEGNPQITLYEYEKLLKTARTSEELEQDRKEIVEKKKNFAAEVKAEARRMLPKEMQKAKEDKIYCDEWLPQAIAIGTKEKALKAKEIELVEREKEMTLRERTLEIEVENRAQDLYRELRDNFFEKMREKIVKLKNSILNVLEKLLPMVIFSEIKEAISKSLNNFEKQIEIDNEEINTEIEKEEVDI